jgi:hypothetical protein
MLMCLKLSFFGKREHVSTLICTHRIGRLVGGSPLIFPLLYFPLRLSSPFSSTCQKALNLDLAKVRGPEEDGGSIKQNKRKSNRALPPSADL